MQQASVLLMESPGWEEQDLDEVIQTAGFHIFKVNNLKVAKRLKEDSNLALIASSDQCAELGRLLMVENNLWLDRAIPVILLLDEVSLLPDVQLAPCFLLAGCVDRRTTHSLLPPCLNLLRELAECKLERAQMSLGIEVLESELAEKRMELEAVSSLDMETGLFNSHYFYENLRREWRQAVRGETVIGLLLFALRGADDLVLSDEGRGGAFMREIGRALHSSLLRPVDIVAHAGEGQFLVLLPDTDRRGADAVAKRLIAAAGKALAREGIEAQPHVGGAVTKPIGNEPEPIMRMARKAFRKSGSTINIICENPEEEASP